MKFERNKTLIEAVILLLFIVTCTFPHNSQASFSAVYSEFSTEEFDNNAPNGLINYWKLDCKSDSICDLTQLAFSCKDKKVPMRPYLDFYSSKLGTLRDLKITGNPKNISFEYMQDSGPDHMLCNIKMSTKDPTKPKEAKCVGSGRWSAGTLYTRENRLITSGPFNIEERCNNKIEFP